MFTISKINIFTLLKILAYMAVYVFCMMHVCIVNDIVNFCLLKYKLNKFTLYDDESIYLLYRLV